MAAVDWVTKRQTAVHLLRSGMAPSEVAAEMGHAVSWVCKYRDRYAAEGWEGMADHSRAPHEPGNACDKAVVKAVCRTRSVLEARAASGKGLRYIGSHAIRGELQAQHKQGQYTAAIPSTATIERILKAAQLTHPHMPETTKIHYPHLQPTAPHELIQVDIVPHYRRGGQAVACFNALDVVSRYPTGQALAQRRAQDAGSFLVHTWQTLGIPQYTQVDNEGCFSGGFTHPGVLGKVVRLALYVGTELLFSPCYHPASNGYVERFHQDYNAHVWHATELADIPAVQQQAEDFFTDYRHSPHHSALAGQTPTQVHQQNPPTYLDPDFEYAGEKLPLVPGRVHFLRKVNAQGTVKVLNLEWEVPEPDVTRGVWVTVEFTLTGATLSIYDAAPDVTARTCLASYPFPLKETVMTREAAIAQLLPPTPPADEAPTDTPTPTTTLATPASAPLSLSPVPQASGRQPLQLPLAIVLLVLSSLVKRRTPATSRCHDG